MEGTCVCLSIKSFKMIKLSDQRSRRPSESACLHNLVIELIQGKTPWEILVSSSRYGEVQQIASMSGAKARSSFHGMSPKWATQELMLATQVIIPHQQHHPGLP